MQEGSDKSRPGAENPERGGETVEPSSTVAAPAARSSSISKPAAAASTSEAGLAAGSTADTVAVVHEEAGSGLLDNTTPH